VADPSEPVPVEPGASAAAVRALVRTGVVGVERRLSTDHANLSIGVDDRYVVKWFATPRTDDDLALLERLAAEGFAHMPEFVGVVRDGSAVTAVVTEFVPHATDGWTWYVDDVIGWLDRSRPLGEVVEWAARMGAITADLHGALSSTMCVRTLAEVREEIGARRSAAIDLVVRGGAWPAEGERLRSRLGLIDDALALLDGDEEHRMQWTHGDLHAGQFLRAGDRLLLTDFDGDPFAPSGSKVVVAPVERDVASLVQSIDHVGRVAAKRWPGADVAPFVRAGVTAALEAYRDRMQLDDQLLWPLRVAQELHEYAYAATKLPIWMYVPDQAMAALLPAVQEHHS
jgi:maltokinase